MVTLLARHLEIRLLVSGLERCLACHPERSEGSGETAAEILSAAKDDMPSLQMSIYWLAVIAPVALSM